MKAILTASFLFTIVLCKAQTDEEKLITTLKEFHVALVKKNTITINQQTDKALTYGHSNGWIETKTEVINDLETGLISYNSFKEDSINVMINDNIASARFVADLNVTLKGNTSVFRLKVLEVWVKKGKRWILFARQAVRA
ncbi:MAG: nuclear transport factor 2 family protein [Ferruginibacter sp.]